MTARPRRREAHNVLAADGHVIGSIHRVGSLPTCVRYFAYDARGERLGPARRWRCEAVAEVVIAHGETS